MVKVRVALLIFLFSVVQAAPGHAAFEQEKYRFYELLAQDRYLAAGQFLAGRKDLLNEPFFIREYTHLLVDKYITTVNFTLFALKDLGFGEEVLELRGKTHDSVIVGASLEELLHTRLAKFPDNPEVNFAVGEYLSRGKACGCFQMPRYFNGDKGDEFPYLAKAYDGGVFDYWSLFRLGMHYHRARSGEDASLDKAIAFYKKSAELNAGHNASTYNLAVAYFQKGDDRSAEKYAERALGKYDNDSLNADTYILYASIKQALGKTSEAEYSYERVLFLRNWDDSAFASLLAIYRATGKKEKYMKLVQDYIAIDYSNNFLFSNYFSFISDQGVNEWDKQIFKAIGARDFKKQAEMGAVSYSLGRFAELIGNRQQALRWYQKALDAFLSVAEPPDGAIAALRLLVAKLSEDTEK